MRVRTSLTCVVATASLAAVFGPVTAALAGSGSGYFYAEGPKPVPNGHGAAKLKILSTLPTDIDPVLDDVNLSIRVKHPKVHDLVLKLKRPDFVGPSGPFGGPRAITLSDRDARGRNFGRGSCPDDPPAATPASFTTFDDAASIDLSAGSGPYEGSYDPAAPLAGFNGYHHAPSTDPASPEEWTLIVKDVADNRKAGRLRCAVLFLSRI